MSITDKPWANWPLTLPEGKILPHGQDPKSYAEYKKINDQEFLTRMTAEIRLNAYNALRKACVERLNVNPDDGVAVVLAGGVAADWELYCSDTDKDVFRQEAFFRHLFQVNEADLYGMIDISNPAGPFSALGVPFLPQSASRWNGEPKTSEYYCKTYGFDDSFIATTPEGSSSPVTDYLTKRNIKTILVLYGQNSDSGLFTKTTARFDGIDTFTIDKTILYRELSLLQSVKTDMEIEFLRHCCNMSARAHTFVMANIHKCMTELQCEALFTAYCAFYGSSRANAYTCICGSNHRGAILHYPYNSGRLADGDMIVLDMGGEYHGMATDLTRSYPINGKFTQQQREIYNIVRAAQLAVFDEIRPGAFWPDLHKLSERVIIEGLHKIGLFQGDVEECKKNHVAQLIYPHGLGHLMGHNVHCVGGYIDCPEKENTPGVCWLRLGRKLEKNMVLTVEPGIYFNFSWIRDCLEENPHLKPFVNMEKLEEYRQFGGVRLEDNIAVTADGYELLTGEWPSTPEEIEAVCALFK